MTTGQTIILAILVLTYLTYTLTFAIKFNRDNKYFSKTQMYAHNILIWILPIIWIFFLNTFLKPTMGMHQHKKKTDLGSSYESGLGIWADNNDGSSHDGGHG
jgi:hypothetical protein